MLLSSSSTKISKPFWVKSLEIRNDLPVTSLVYLPSRRAQLFDVQVIARSRGALVFVGRYLSGQLHGPAWLFSPDDPDQATGALLVRWDRGRLQEEDAVVLLPGWDRAAVGRLQPGLGRLTAAHSFPLTAWADQGCVRLVRVPRYLRPGTASLPAPVRVRGVGGRVAVTSSRLLLFNRVAKVGSQSLIRLLVELGPSHGFTVTVDQRGEEVYNDPPWERLRLAEQLASSKEPRVWVRHYNFLGSPGPHPPRCL